jgi:XTP/dITP diphosphohydrolase
MEILFATGNKHKVEEATRILGDRGIQVRQLHFKHNEIRSDSLEEIAREAVEAAFSSCGKPIFVEDTGLFIDSMSGFPGTFSAWVQGKIGNQGILRLLEGGEGRSASFRTCIAYHDGKGIHAFHGECRGSIAQAPMGEGGFGYDPVFVPDGQSLTFAQGIALKNNISHRYKALEEFSKYLTSR